MRNRSAGVLTLGLGLLVLAPAAETLAQTNPVAEAQTLRREANQAYQTGDYEAFTRSMHAALELNPASLRTRFDLARGYARTGQPQQALELLRQLTAARADFDMENHEDLISLRALPEFQTLVAELESGIEPVVASSGYYSFDQLGVIPEGIAHDPETDRLFFGSMRTGDIYALDGERQLSKFADVNAGSGRSAIGMTVDAERHVLWVVGTSFFMAENFDAEVPTQSGVFGFDLTSGALQHEYPIAEGGFGLNDVALGPNGELYASGQDLHVLDEEQDALVPLVTEPAAFGSNGIAAHPDGQTLFFSSYPVGLGAIDLATRRMRFLDVPVGASLYGIDGMYWYDGGLVAIQNGIEPWRLIKASVNEELTAVTDIRVIEIASPAATPTTGAIIAGIIHYIGQAPSPETIPTQYPESLAPFTGKTLIRTAPLKR